MIRMLSLDEVRARLAELEYWPGWVITLEEGRLETEGPQLRIRADVEDAYHPGQTVALDIWTYLPPIPYPEYFDAWLHWRLCRIAVHETSEGLRRGGRPIFDPHAERDPDTGGAAAMAEAVRRQLPERYQ